MRKSKNKKKRTNKPMPATGQFRTILADPPWAYRNWSAKKHGAVAAQYPTQSKEELAAIPVSKWADPRGCMLVLWGTWPHAAEACDLLRDWGFEHVTGCPWVKTVPSSGLISTGIGFWFQSTSEFVLLGRSGKAKRRRGAPPVKGLLVDEVFYAPKGSRHSEKPRTLHDWIEANMDGPYLELFPREERPGWTTWGRDTGFWLSAGGVEPVPPPATPATPATAPTPTGEGNGAA